MEDEQLHRRRVRHPVELDAVLHIGDGPDRPARVSNLSLEGCCVEGWYRIGDEVEISLPRIGRVKGQVRWAIGGRAGIRFLTPEERRSA